MAADKLARRLKPASQLKPRTSENEETEEEEHDLSRGLSPFC